MIRIDGHLFEPDVSDCLAATAEISTDGRLTVTAGLEKTLGPFDWAEVEVSPRVGSIPRKLILPDGCRFETQDNAAVDEAELKFRGRTAAFHVDLLERVPKYIVAGLAACLIIGFVVYRWGIPAAADGMAAVVPQVALDIMTDQSMIVFDRVYFEETELSEARRGELNEGFGRVIQAAGLKDDCCDLLFRQSPIVGANAFALPDGTVILTDELIELAGSDDEILAVLAHEVAHVSHRHGLRALLQASLYSGVIMLVAGDLNEMGELALSLPALLVNAGYSRKFEKEADLTGAETLKQMGLEPALLAEILRRLTEDCGSHCDKQNWLSSHPSTSEREEYLKELK